MARAMAVAQRLVDAAWPLLSGRGVGSAIQAASPENPSTSLSNPDQWFVDWATGGATATGKAVNEQTAMQVSAVYACVGIISGTIASLPLDVHERTETGSTPAPDHPVANLMRSPHPIVTDYIWREMLLERLLLQGNGLAVITRRGDFRPAELLPLERSNLLEVRNVNGRLKYRLDIPTAPGQSVQQILDQDFVVHIAGPGFNGTWSPSPIRQAARNAIGLALATEEYQGRYLSQGGRPSGVLEVPDGIGETARADLKASWSATYGGLANVGRTALLYGGAQFKPISFSHEDAEILATRRFEVEEICRVYGVPLHMVQSTEKSTSFGRGLEEQSLGFIRYTLRRHIKRAEAELNRKLFRGDERGRYFLKFNMDALLRGTSKDQAAFLEGLVSKAAIMTPNEARARLNLPPLEDGDTLRQPTGAPTQDEGAPAPDSEEEAEVDAA